MPTRLKGVLAIVPTAFREDESLDLDAQSRHIQGLVDVGVHGIVAAGSTGEFASLEDTERKELVECCIAAADGRVPVVIGSAANSTRSTIEHSQFAENAGAAALMIVPPYYCVPSEDELVAHFAKVADSVSIPIIAYNNPRTSGIDMHVGIIGRLAQIERIEYVKDSTGNYRRLKDLLTEFGDRLGVFNSPGVFAVEALMAGAVGWISASANVFPDSILRLYAHAQDGDWEAARQIAKPLYGLEERIATDGQFVQIVKMALELLNRTMGPPRAPLQRPSGRSLELLKQALHHADLGPRH